MNDREKLARDLHALAILLLTAAERAEEIGIAYLPDPSPESETRMKFIGNAMTLRDFSAMMEDRADELEKMK